MRSFVNKNTILLLILSLIIVTTSLLFFQRQNTVYATEQMWDGTTYSADNNYTFSDGDGSEDSPYLISSVQDFLMLQANVNAGNKYSNKYFKLTCSIDLNGNQWTPIGNTVSNYFAGNFDGGNNVIKNLTMYYDSPNETNNTYLGLFGNYQGGNNNYLTIKNLHINSVKLQAYFTSSSNTYIGILVGYCNAVNILNCSVTSNDTINNMNGETYTSVEVEINSDVSLGGLVGFVGSYGGELSYLSSKLNIAHFNFTNTQTIERVGGLIGKTDVQSASLISLKQCSYEGNITSEIDYNTNNMIGGLIGDINTFNIDNCYVAGDISIITSGSTKGTYSYFGGLFGRTKTNSKDASLYNCFYKGNLGFSGDVESYEASGSIIGCVDGNNNTIYGNLYSNESSMYGLKTGSGNLQTSQDTDDFIQLSTDEEWKDKNNFKFNFDDYWNLLDESSYPTLKGYVPINILTVNFYDGIDNEQVFKTIDVQENSSINLNDYSTLLINEGYKLLGWTTDKSGLDAEFEIDEELLITANVNLYAIWQQYVARVVKNDVSSDFVNFVDALQEINNATSSVLLTLLTDVNYELDEDIFITNTNVEITINAISPLNLNINRKTIYYIGNKTDTGSLTFSSNITIKNSNAINSTIYNKTQLNIIIDGATIVSEGNYCVYNENNGSIIVNNGTLNSTNSTIYNYFNGLIDLQGGNIFSNNSSGYNIINNSTGIIKIGSANFVSTSGKIISVNAPTNYCVELASTLANELSINVENVQSNTEYCVIKTNNNSYENVKLLNKGWYFEEREGLLYAKDVYTISYKNGDFNTNEIYPTQFNYNSEEQKLTIPYLVKEGYEFKGYNVNSTYVSYNLINKQLTINGEFCENVVLTAIFEAGTTTYKVNHFKQNLNTLDYSLFESETLQGLTETQTSAVAKEYIGFVAKSFSQLIISGDGKTEINIYYDREKYSVVLNVGRGIEKVAINNGTSIESSEKVSIDVLYEQEIVISATLKSGYTFRGWFNYSSENIGTEYSNVLEKTIKIEQNLNLIAVGQGNTFKVNLFYNIKENQTIADNSVDVEYEQAYNLGNPSEEKIGYFFSSWYYINSEQQVEIPSNGESWTFSESEIDVYAKWEPRTDTPYKVEYYFQSVDLSNYEIDNGLTKNLSGTTLSEANYEIVDVVGFYKFKVSAQTNENDEYEVIGFNKITISADGSLVIKIYYNRESYEITLNITTSNAGGGINGGVAKFSNGQTTMQFVYGSDVDVSVEYYEGYEINNVTVLNNNLTIPNIADKKLATITFNNVLGQEQINIEFILTTLTITLQQDVVGGTISFESGYSQNVYYGNSCEIIATPSSDYKFKQFKITGSNYSCDNMQTEKLILQDIKEDLTINAVFVEVFSVVVIFNESYGQISYNNNIVESEKEVGKFEKNMTVELILIPLETYYHVNAIKINDKYFTNYEAVNNVVILNVQVTEPTTIEVEFDIEKYLLQVESNIANISTQTIKIGDTISTSNLFPRGEIVTISTQAPEGYFIKQWLINEQIYIFQDNIFTGNEISLQIEKSISISIIYEILVTAEQTEFGNVFINDNNDKNFSSILVLPNDKIDIKAESDFGYKFLAWITPELQEYTSGEAALTEITNFVVTKPLTIKAEFASKECTVVVICNQSHGKVNCNFTSETSFKIGDVFTIEAVSFEGYEFNGYEIKYLNSEYNGLFSLINNPQSYTVVANDVENEQIIITALFRLIEFDLTIKSNKGGKILLNEEDVSSYKTTFNYFDNFEFVIQIEEMYILTNINCYDEFGNCEELSLNVENNKLIITPNKTVELEFLFSPVFWTDDSLRANCFTSGEGTQNDPFIISNAKELALMSYLINNGLMNNNTGLYYNVCYYKLNNNINLKGYFWEPIGIDEMSKRFDGVLDYDFYKIANAKIENPQLITYYDNVFAVIGNGKCINRFKTDWFTICCLSITAICCIGIISIIVWKINHKKRVKKVIILPSHVQANSQAIVNNKSTINKPNLDNLKSKNPSINFDKLNKK